MHSAEPGFSTKRVSREYTFEGIRSQDATPTGTGLSGQLTAVSDAHGSQVAYNGHLLHTFVTDQAGQVTGQGVQDFFVATPGMAPITGASAPASTRPASGGYGY